MRRFNDTARGWQPADYSPEQLSKQILAQHAALGRPIDLWSFHHTDGYDIALPQKFQHSLHAVNHLVRQGVIRNVGLCNCSIAHIDLALEILPICAIQNQFSLWDRAAEKPRIRKIVAKSNKNDIIAAVKKKGLLFCPYGALGGHQAREGNISCLLGSLVGPCLAICLF